MDGHRVSTDAGCLLVGQLDRSFGITKRLVRCFKDRRNQDFIEHDLLTLIRQRVYGLVAGYEDLNDHDFLRVDPILAAACGQDDVFGEQRRREEDRGKGLAGKSTFNRVELGAGLHEDDRYKRVQADLEQIEDFFIEEFVRSVKKGTARVILDIDTSCAPVYGEQEQRFFHGYYDQYCLLPLFMFCGSFPVVARLRSAESEQLDDTIRVVEKVVKRLRQKHRHGGAGRLASEAPRQPSRERIESDQRRTATVERVPDPNSDELEKLWDQEWRRNLLEASIVRVRKRVNAKQYQMFNLYVMLQWPMNQVKRTLGVSAAQVYMAKMRIGRMIKSEVRTLERKMI